MTCRRLVATDTATVLLLARAAFASSDTYSWSVVKDFCTKGQGFIDTKTRGYALYEERKSDLAPYHTVPTLVQLGVCPSCRRQGIAQELVRAVMSCYKRPIYLHVRSQNIAAQRLYAKLKFVTVATLPDYYVKDNAYYMVYIPAAPAKLPPSHTWRPLT